jgi:hypothetical protein
VWTPKRIILLASGFMLFFAAYVAYAATYFGRIDSLPPLPDADKPRVSSPKGPGPRRAIHPINIKLERAFGAACEELKRPIKLDLHSKNMVLSAEACNFVNGRLELTPISLALFSKDKGDGKGPEINTIKAKVAYLTFDRPINSPNEINGRKILEAELIDNIEIVNNRRTPARDDDLVLLINKGPLYYNESKHLVWTRDRINLKDYQSKPDPIDIQGSGMEMELVTQPAPAKAGQAPSGKPKSETISGVKRIVLTADVIMHLYAEPGNGVMSGPKKTEPAKPAVKPADAPEAPKEHIEIRTAGPFQYDFLKDFDLAQFDVPRDAAARNVPLDVTVIRFHGRGPGAPQDQLICQHLELQLRHKDNKDGNGAAGPDAPPTPQPQDPDQGLEIETAHATAGHGKPVVLTSDLEKLHALGTDFFYDARTKLTVLKGEPEIEAHRDESIIYAREMRIQETKLPPVAGHEPEVFQKVIAVGPGNIHMMNKTAKKRTTHAYWNDLLTSTRDGPNDLLILTGNARFVDDEQGQSLEARLLKVWLLPEDKDKDKKPTPKPAATAKPGETSATAEQGRKPHHLEAIENVKSRSKELIIHDTEKLVVWFKDVPVLPGNTSPGLTKSDPSITTTPTPAGTPGSKAAPTPTPPAGAPAAPQPMPQARQPLPSAPQPTPSAPPPASAPPASPPPASTPPTTVAPAPLPIGTPTTPASPASGPALGTSPAQTPAATPEPPPPRPIDLSARLVEAYVLRADDKNQLDRLWTEGNVHVRQEPAKPDEKAVDIKGDTMQMTCKPEGNFLVVNSGEVAHLQMDKILIMGPEVNIDQASNRAWVHGFGAMTMESATNFQGAKLDRPVPLTVMWNKDMYFNGEYAEFFGGIQAEQENSRLACQRLQVFFDRPVSLKEGNHSDQPARVRNLVCDQNVRVEDRTLDRNRQLVKFQAVSGAFLEMNTLTSDEEPRPGTPPKEGNQVRVAGPGDVRLLQRGAADPLNSNPPRADPGSAPVRGTPVSVSRTGPERRPAPADKAGDDEMKMTYVTFLQRMDANSLTNTANFWGGVQVLNFPCDNPTEEIDLDAILSRELPPNWMYLRCDRLQVFDRPNDGHSNQQMRAYGRVRVIGKEYSAESDTMTFDEAKDLVVFIGDRNNPATLTKQVGVGVQKQTLSGQKIYYRRGTGEAYVEGADRINR